MSRLELETEKSELLATIAELDRILGDDGALRALVSEELADVAARHAKPRVSSIVDGDEVISVSAVPLEVADDACLVVLTASGKVLRSPVGTATGAKPGKHSSVRAAVTTTTRSDFGIITNQGRVIRHSAMEIPALGESTADFSGGAPAATLAALRSKEQVIGITALPPSEPGLVLATRAGVVKRVVPDVPGAAADWQVIRLDDDDEVVFAADLQTGDEELVFITSHAQLLRFSASLVRPQGRPAGGVAAMTLTDGARILHAAAIVQKQVDHAYVTTIAVGGGVLPGTAAGTCKISPLAEYPRKGRATAGVRCQKFLKGEDALALACVSIDLPLALTASGAVAPLPEPRRDKRDASGEFLDKVVTALGSRL